MTESTTSEADRTSHELETDPEVGVDGGRAVEEDSTDAGQGERLGEAQDEMHHEVEDTGAGSASEAATEASAKSDGASAGDAESDGDSAGDGESDGDSAGDGESDGDSAGEGEGGADGVAVLEREGDIAADYLEELLDIADLDGDLDMDVEGDRAAVSIVGGDVSMLVGRNGEVLEALQELTRLAVYRETGRRSRLMLDVGGFRADARSRLERIAGDAVEQVKRSGDRLALAAMSPFERKVVHDTVAAAGLSSESDGEEPRRHVVVLPE